MIRRPPRSTRTDTLFPYTTLFRSARMTLAASWGAIEPDFTAVTGDLRELPPVEPFEVLAARLPMTPTQRDALLQANTLAARRRRSEEHTSELQSLMRISYAVFCLKKKKTQLTLKDNTTANRY